MPLLAQATPLSERVGEHADEHMVLIAIGGDKVVG
jgi:hypothetical protein